MGNLTRIKNIKWCNGHIYSCNFLGEKENGEVDTEFWLDNRLTGVNLKNQVFTKLFGSNYKKISLEFILKESDDN